ncbi:isoprenylcysteine carboxyl methyltransferase family protein [Desertibacillus haloalkaliphilus]|uniref:isoprenylcysteine carboxyl methyltransferase family protein n=1 Tax=Desertibacillus haloalkaliphilus TaxID=1328930 RepID=UPI001C2678A0|nr:isoprenylcysteine carboxylmethyltransferase family protein [Desertibacillus haloalkaliphilus]MBU8906379.1 isoprenylcysteine carboxyl methyltransferase [Desertibacillus haloalkaliphilus]
MALFFMLISVVIVQRMIELLIANKNALVIKEKGGYEVGREHYKYIVALHIGFFASFVSEVLLFDRSLFTWWWFPLLLFGAAQLARAWSLSSLGVFWNTRIIVLPGAEVIAKGPYRFMKHPNYVIVATELIALPLLFQAYVTAVVFTILNAVMMIIRIPIEERALMEATNYQKVFQSQFRFFPKFK